MPLQNEVSRNSYVKIDRIVFGSNERNENSRGPYVYQIDLKNQIDNVIGCELTGYSFPSRLAPTFITSSPGVIGTDAVDFFLQAGAIIGLFSFKWPANQFSYQNLGVPYLSYVNVLKEQLQAAVEADAIFGTGGPHQATFQVVADPEEITHIVVSGAGVDGLGFQFASGPNNESSAFNQMGWNKVDTPAALVVKSPGIVALNPYVYFDVSIDEFAEFQPVKRIYVMDNQVYSTIRNDPSITRARLLSSQPIRRLKRLSVRITLEGGIVPPVFEGLDHQITLTIFSLQPENYALPQWMRQVFVM
jgi:hypothetical protein